jgi:hypothetical protein
MGRAEEFLASFLPSFHSAFVHSLSTIFSTLSRHFERMRALVTGRSSASAEACTQADAMERAAAELRLASASISPSAFCRDSTATIYLCPTRLRRNARRRRAQDPPPACEVVLERPAVLISLRRQAVSVIFRLTREHTILQRTARATVFANSQVAEIHVRRQRNSALEIFLDTGKSFFLEFGVLDLPGFMRLARKTDIPASALPNLEPPLARLEERWASGEISSFEYIIRLNAIDGRSFRDTSEYPIFPALQGDKIRPAGAVVLDLDNILSGDVWPADLFFRADDVSSLRDVELRRLALEKAPLHEWLAAAFRRLFRDRPHRARIALRPRRGFSSSADIAMGAPIAAATEVSRTRLLLILRDGAVGVLQLSGAAECTFVRRADGCPGSVAAAADGQIVVREKETITIIEDGRPNTTLPVFTSSEVFYPIGEEVLFCPEGATVGAVGRAGPRKICPARGRVARIAADRTFRIIALATVDGWVRVFDLATGSEVAGADLGGEARLLSITPKWGCVVAAVGDEVVVLTVNGQPIHREKMPFRIAQWWPFSSAADFDYVAFVTDARVVGTFQVLHPEKSQVFQEAKDDLVFIRFDPVAAAFLLLSQNGQLLILPWTSFD